jgi:hypothetical protein
MAMRSQRFGVRNATGARSSEWVAMWKTNTSDVYLATRTLGRSMKASFHESGRCHVRAPGPQGWRGVGEPPFFLEEWSIDPASSYAFPFSIVIPEQELRSADWPQHKDKGTVWVEAQPGRGVEVAIFLVRALGDLSANLRAAGWHTGIADALLPDGRRLLVVAGHGTVPTEKLAELKVTKAATRASLEREATPARNPRLVLVAGANEQGTRKFVEAAVYP